MSQQTSTAEMDKTELSSLTRGALRKTMLACILLFMLFFGVLAAGLVTFSGYVLLASETKPTKADAIVVVTGGAGRLESAIALYREGLGEKLLISGVHANYSAETLKKRFQLNHGEINCCIELDSVALNTVANATQTALWAKKHGLDSLIIVTSAYHMPRTMLEMRRAAPLLNYQSYLVTSQANRSLFTRIFDINTMRLLTKEYGKLLAAIMHGTSERLKAASD